MPITVVAELVVNCIPTAAGNGNTTANMTRPFAIMDVTCHCTATDGGAGTAQLLRQPAAGGGYTAITNAIVFTTANNVTRAGTLDGAQTVFATGDSLRLTLAGGTGAGGAGTENGFVRAWILPTAI